MNLAHVTNGSTVEEVVGSGHNELLRADGNQCAFSSLRGRGAGDDDANGSGVGLTLDGVSARNQSFRLRLESRDKGGVGGTRALGNGVGLTQVVFGELAARSGKKRLELSVSLRNELAEEELGACFGGGNPERLSTVVAVSHADVELAVGRSAAGGLVGIVARRALSVEVIVVVVVMVAIVLSSLS